MSDQDDHDDGTMTFYVSVVELIQMLQMTAGVNDELHQQILDAVRLPQ